VIDGAHDVLGAEAPSTTWTFAEGTLRAGFTEFVTLQNPNPSTAIARIEYFLDGAAPVVTTRTLAPTSRSTIVVGDPANPGSLGVAAPANIDFGLRVTADAPIVAERPIYVAAAIAGINVNDGTDTLGFASG
jgi:hypothetical protein